MNDGLQRIEDYAFRECKALKNINFPSTLLEVGTSAFSFCTSLEEVVLNEGLQKIGMGAFANCRSLKRITIPHTVTEISERTFFNCLRLREVRLHDNIQKVAWNAFYVDFGGPPISSLERFTFPSISTRLDTISWAGQTEVENKVDEIRGQIERSGSELFVSVSSPLGGIIINSGNWKVEKEILGRINRLLTYYELREATTCLNWQCGNQRLIKLR